MIRPPKSVGLALRMVPIASAEEPQSRRCEFQPVLLAVSPGTIFVGLNSSVHLAWQVKSGPETAIPRNMLSFLNPIFTQPRHLAFFLTPRRRSLGSERGRNVAPRRTAVPPDP